MPIYEYHCQRCESDFEYLVRADEAANCPDCGSDHLQKLLSVTASPQAGSSELPVCSPPQPGGCGKPQCGMGGCQM